MAVLRNDPQGAATYLAGILTDNPNLVDGARAFVSNAASMNRKAAGNLSQRCFATFAQARTVNSALEIVDQQGA